MLKKLCGIGILLVSIFLVFEAMNKEVKSIYMYEKEKTILEKEVDITKLTIPEWNFERIIKKGTIHQIDSLFATQIDSNQNNIIIAGHDIPTVFHPLQKIKLGMRIRISKGNKIIEYTVTNILSVSPTEIKYLEETKNEQLTLITCTEQDQKRLIIIGTKNT